MTNKLEFYKCKICGNVVQVMFEGVGELVCCNEPMELLNPQYEENEVGEKHVPEFESVHEGCETGMCTEAKYITLRKHPMVPEHYIQMIEALSEDKSVLHIKFLNPNETAQFNITNLEKITKALELCNIHGLWRSK